MSDTTVPMLLGAALLALLPASIASRKGHSFLLWWLYGVAFWIVALPHALLTGYRRICPHCDGRIPVTAPACPICGGRIALPTLENSAAPPASAQPAPRTSEKQVVGVLVLVALLVYLAGGFDKLQDALQRGPVQQTAGTTWRDKPPAALAPAPAPDPVLPPLPQLEQALLTIIARHASAYQGAANEMVAGGMRVERARDICRLMAPGNGVVRDWVGTVEALNSSPRGLGALSIRLDARTTLVTSRSEWSDQEFRTLLPYGGKLWKTATALSLGSPVIFSGNFFPSPEDCLKEISLSVKGDLTEPEFLFRFTALKGL